MDKYNNNINNNSDRNNSQMYLIGQGENQLSGTDNPAADLEPEIRKPNGVLKNTKESCDGCLNKNNTALNLQEEKYTRSIKHPVIKPTFREWIKAKTNKNSLKKLLAKRVPITAWLPQYNKSFAVSDLVAGITVGLTIIPQGIAHSSVAGLPPQIGLYSCFMACFVYTIFGSVKDSAIGSTAIMALLARENNHGFGVDGAVLLCLLTGCVQLVMGLLQLGFLIDFISGPVSIGFTSAAAIIIATTQVKDLLGLNFQADNFLAIWENVFEHISETRIWDFILGMACMSLILFLRRSKDYQIGPVDVKDRKPIHKHLENAVWLISTSRNIIVVVVCTTMGYIFERQGNQPFVLTGFVKPGLPNFQAPPFSTMIGNTTYSFVDMTSTMGSAIIVVPLLGILENIALAKVFAEGKAIDATQEMLALGLCNIASSFVSAMPISGALARGAVNNASGVKTTLGGVYTGIIVILALHLFTPYFFYIPKASLAAVIVAAVIFMVELHVIKPIWRTKKTDLIPAIATFLCCLFLRLEIGIAIGIGLNLISLLYASARPSVVVEKVTSPTGCEYLLITPDRSLAFPSVDYVRSTVTKAGVKQGSSSTPVVVDARHIQGADFTAAKGIKLLIEDFVNRKQPILFYNLKPSVISIFQGVQPKDFVYCNTYTELDEILKQYMVSRENSIESNDVITINM